MNPCRMHLTLCLANGGIRTVLHTCQFRMRTRASIREPGAELGRAPASSSSGDGPGAGGGGSHEAPGVGSAGAATLKRRMRELKRRHRERRLENPTLKVSERDVVVATCGKLQISGVSEFVPSDFAPNMEEERRPGTSRSRSLPRRRPRGGGGGGDPPAGSVPGPRSGFLGRRCTVPCTHQFPGCTRWCMCWPSGHPLWRPEAPHTCHACTCWSRRCPSSLTGTAVPGWALGSAVMKSAMTGT